MRSSGLRIFSSIDNYGDCYDQGKACVLSFPMYVSRIWFYRVRSLPTRICAFRSKAKLDMTVQDAEVVAFAPNANGLHLILKRAPIVPSSRFGARLQISALTRA